MAMLNNQMVGGMKRPFQVHWVFKTKIPWLVEKPSQAIPGWFLTKSMVEKPSHP